jgi:hypothetical protein
VFLFAVEDASEEILAFGYLRMPILLLPHYLSLKLVLLELRRIKTFIYLRIILGKFFAKIIQLNLLSSGSILFYFLFEQVYFGGDVFQGLVLRKHLQALTKFFADLVNVLVGGVLKQIDLIEHMLLGDERFVDSSVEPLVHRLLWLAEPDKNVWLSLHSNFVIFIVEVLLFTCKLLKDVLNVRAVQRNWVAECSAPHLRKGLSDVFEVFIINLIGTVNVQQMKALLHLFVLCAVKHDIKIV